MRPFRTAFAFTASVTLALACSAGCGGCNKSGSGGRITAGGATFVDPIMQEWAAEYNKIAKVEIDYTAQGSGYGIKELTAKTLAFGCTDAPMKKAELDAANAAGGEVIHVPVAIGAVAVVYKLNGVIDLKLTGEVLADIFLHKIAKWNDPAITALNPGVALPDLAIVPVSRSDKSGTTNIFTEYLSKVSPEFKKDVGTSTLPTWPKGGIGQAGSGGIASHVKDNLGCIGYVELSFAKTNNLGYASLKNKKGSFVKPEAEGVTAAAEAASNDKPTAEPYTLHELTFSLTDTEGEKAYPIVGVSYAIAFTKPPVDKGGKLVAPFLKWAVTDGQKFAIEKDYAPLPEELRKRCVTRIEKIVAE